MGILRGSMSFAELRQRGHALARSLREEAAVRTREDGQLAVQTELHQCEVLQEESGFREQSEAKERDDLDQAERNKRALQSSVYQAVDETCFHSVESTMRKFPM